MKGIYFLFVFIFIFNTVKAAFILIPMDDSQTDHLKAYGVAYWILEKGVPVDWLLNYEGGSFSFKYDKSFENECLVRGVKFQVIPDAQMSKILIEIANPELNMDAMRLEKPPKIAVYSPKSKLPWDDAVTLVLVYAEIPYTVIYDDEIYGDELHLYDWLHLHHEDFTGQYGKFYRSYQNAPWYLQQVSDFESKAAEYGYDKVSEAKLAIALKIRDFVAGGGFLFAMCSATDSYDIALAAEGVDICPKEFDHDPIGVGVQEKLDFSKTFAFDKFTISQDPNEYEFSNIDTDVPRSIPQGMDFFTLFDFSAKWDPIPTMLTQCHTKTIAGFMGQTTSFKKDFIKSSVLILGETKSINEAKYIHGDFGNGTWTFYGGHDPADYRHLVGDPATDLSLHPNSPGYRLILNNILFPAAKKQKQKT